MALNKGHLQIVKYLIEKNADPNIQDKYGYTPLILASKSDYFDIVKYLIKNNAEKCEKHQILLNNHKNDNCCDKSQGIKAYITCNIFKNLQNNIKKCRECIKISSDNISNSLKDNDFIIKSAILNENELFSLEGVIERKLRSRNSSLSDDKDENFERKNI